MTVLRNWFTDAHLSDHALVRCNIKGEKRIIDSVTEFQGGPGPYFTDVSGIIQAEQHFLPKSSLVMQLLRIRDNPIDHFLPTKVNPDGSFICVAPPSLTSELAELFMFRVTTPSAKCKATSTEKARAKRRRLNSDSNADNGVVTLQRNLIAGKGRSGIHASDSSALGVGDYDFDQHEMLSDHEDADVKSTQIHMDINNIGPIQNEDIDFGRTVLRIIRRELDGNGTQGKILTFETVVDQVVWASIVTS